MVNRKASPPRVLQHRNRPPLTQVCWIGNSIAMLVFRHQTNVVSKCCVMVDLLLRRLHHLRDLAGYAAEFSATSN